MALTVIGCKQLDSSSENTKEEVSVEANEEQATNDVAIENETSEENYFEFLYYLNVGLTPTEIANIMPSNAKLEKPDIYMDDLDDFLYHVQSDDIKGMVKFYKWNYDKGIWSFECSLNWENNPNKGEELYNKIFDSLKNVYGEPADLRKFYAEWEVQINGNPAGISLINTESSIEYVTSNRGGQ
jgi:hypothetical protein